MVLWQFYKTPRIPDPPQAEIWKIDPARYGRTGRKAPFILDPREFHGRTEPIMIEFTKPSRWKSFWSGLLVGMLLMGLLSHAPSAYDYTKAFVGTTATPAEPSTTPPQVVLAPAPTPAPTPEPAPTPKPTNLFVFDAEFLAQGMTPARLNESQGTALFKVLSAPVAPIAPPAVREEESCDDVRCHILVLVKQFESYYPAFISSYLSGEPQEEEEDEKNDDASEPPMDYFDWVIAVDQAIFQGTTPAFFPMVNEESATDFYDMTLGHFRKVKKYESVVKAAFNSLFVLDANLLKNAMTPARLTKVQGQALFELFALQDKCCSVDDVFCRLSALLRQALGHEDDNNSNNNFAWITTVWNSAIYPETTPAYLPSGETDGDSGIPFFQLSEGHSRNPELDYVFTYWQQRVEDYFNAASSCPGTDSVRAIYKHVKNSFFENTEASTKGWFSHPYGYTPAFDLDELVDVVNARFRELRVIPWDYQMQGAVLYEQLKHHHNFKRTCHALWTEHPALFPSTLGGKVIRSLIELIFGKHPMPSIRRRSCIDSSPASDGVDPVEVAQCHAWIRDPDRSDYELANFEYSPVWERSEPEFAEWDIPHLAWDVENKRVAMPQLDEKCHAREFLKYDFLQNIYDYSNVCADLWAKYPHTKNLHYRDDSSPYLRPDKSQKPFNMVGLQSFCLSLDIDRTRGGFETDPYRRHGQHLAEQDIIWLLHSD